MTSFVYNALARNPETNTGTWHCRNVLSINVCSPFLTQKTKLAGMLQVPQENRSVLDAENNTTGFRLSLGLTCRLHNLEEEVQSLAANSSDMHMMLLSLTTRHLVQDSCEWVRHGCMESKNFAPVRP